MADHVRCLTFALADGAMPDNEGRGYVLRRILRRAVRYGRQYLGMREPFIHRLVGSVVDAMGGAFSEIRETASHVEEVIRDEEASFGRTLDRGIALFEEAADYAVKHHHGRIGGEDAFKLHDTYGFPIDLTELMAEERGLTVDIGEYARLMEQARELARGRGESAADEFTVLNSKAAEEAREPTDDLSKYGDELQCESFLTSFARHSRLGDTDSAKTGETIAFTVARTCFYAEAGGQVSDIGTVMTDSGEIDVTGVKSNIVAPQDGGKPIEVVVHSGKVVRGEIWPASRCKLNVSPKRLLTMKNHTVTHMMNWALREVLGAHVQQKGSLVDPEKTRFDLSHPGQISDDQLARVEELVNKMIKDDLPVYAEEVPLAKAKGVNTLRAVFGEKYPDTVRVIAIGRPVTEMIEDPKNAEWMRYSVEFCGGTHLKRTGEAGRFRLVEESAVAKGIRRVIGVTAERAEQAERAATQFLKRLREAAGLDAEALPGRVAELGAVLNQTEMPVVEKSRLRADLATLQERAKKAQKQAAKAGTADVKARAEELLAGAERVGETAVIVAHMGAAAVDQLRTACDSLRTRAGSAAIFLSAEQSGKVLLLAAMTPDVAARGIKAGDLIKAIAPTVGGKGGGRPDMAQGGGPDVEKIPEAVRAAGQWLRGKLGER